MSEWIDEAWTRAGDSSGPVYRYVVADVFTDRALEGNQLAVFAAGQGLSTELMQRTARELNLSETVFVLPAEQGGDARIRIFTPATELPFAGHPVLGTAFVLGGRDKAVVRLETGSGVVPVRLEREGERIVFGRMDQPIPIPEPFERTDELFSALGVAGSLLPVEAYVNGPRHVYIALDSQEAVAGLRPDFGALADVAADAGFSCFAGSGRRWKTRMFAPAEGITEDPATGSAAGPLAVHLARHGWIEFGVEIEVSQGAEIGRPSLLHVRVEGSADRVERVAVGGVAVLVARGEYRLPAEPAG